MGWRDEIRKGKFRDAEFSTMQVSGEGGQRNIHHAFPRRNKHDIENNGRREHSFSFECFVHGVDYMDKRDALIAALDKGGTGKLMNPYEGEMDVDVEDYTYIQRTNAGGRAEFTILFFESGSKPNPEVSVDSSAAVLTSATALEESAKADFVNNFDVIGKPEFVGNAAIQMFTDFTDDLNSLNGLISGSTQFVSDLTTQIDDFTNQLTTLITSPADLANDLIGLVSGIRNIATSVESAFSGLLDLYSFGDDAEAMNTTTANRVQQSKNQEAIISLISSTVIAQSAVSISKIDFDENAKIAAQSIDAPALINFTSLDDAIRVRDQVAAQINTRMLIETSTGPIDDEVFKSMHGLRAAIANDISIRAADLKRLVKYTPIETKAAVLIAYDIYGDPGREAEIVARNKIRHPGFVMGGRELEVLTV